MENLVSVLYGVIPGTTTFTRPPTPAERVNATMEILATAFGGFSGIPVVTVAAALTGQQIHGVIHSVEDLAQAWADWQEDRWESPADAGEMVAALTAAGYGE